MNINTTDKVMLQVAQIPIERQNMYGVNRFYKLQIAGGLGGDSKDDIDKGRVNAIQELGHLLRPIKKVCRTFYLAEINGGIADDIIPGSCTAIVGISSQEEDFLYQSFVFHASYIAAAYHREDPNITYSFQNVDYTGGVITATSEILFALDHIPCGVIEEHEELPGKPVSTNNLGRIKTDERFMTISCLTRSFDDEELEGWANVCTREFEEIGAEVEIVHRY